MKVWKMDEYIWVAARSAREAKSAVNDVFDYDESDIREMRPKALTKKQMRTERFYLDVPFEDPTPSVSFQERLDDLIAKGEKFPTLFASTEF